MPATDAGVMTHHTDSLVTRPLARDAARPHGSWMEVVWALVLLQGGFLTATAIESLVVNLGSGFVLLPSLVLTIGAATLTFLVARGLRNRRRWARRTAMVSESFVLAFGLLEVVATVALTGGLPGIVPIVTGVAIPVAVMIFLRKLRSEFQPIDEGAIEFAGALPPTPTNPTPSDDPVLGTVV